MKSMYRFMEDLAQGFPQQTAALKRALRNNDSATVDETLRFLMNQNNPVNIGITGESGSGKSSFVNAFRGIDQQHEEAARIGCIERTTAVKSYPHPDYPHVTLWDHPGVGTCRFPADVYLKRFSFERFDFIIIIISDTRIRENDIKLAREIQRMGKKFYFVHSKTDNDMRAEQRRQRNVSVEKTLTKIRQHCIKELNSEKLTPAQVFILSSFEPQLYDFPHLHEHFRRELPALRKHALLLAVAGINQEIVNMKKDAFKAKIKFRAALSAAGAAVPIPGLSVAVDVGLIITAVREYTAEFGLDKPSVERLADNMRVPVEVLKAVIKSPLAATEITKDLILKVLSQLSVLAALAAVEEGFSFIPIVGTIVAVGLSAFTTSSALNYFLDTLAEDAQRVFQRALDLQTSA